MSNFQTQLRTDLFNNVFKITGETWTPITIAYLIYSSISLIFSLSLGIAAVGKDFQKMFNPTTLKDNPEALQDLFSGMAGQFMTPTFFIILFFFVIGMILLLCWVYNFSYIVTDDLLKNKTEGFVDTVKKSLNKGVFRVFWSGIVVYLIFIALMVVVFATATISGWITFLGFFAMLIFMFRFLLIAPAYILGNMTLSDSFKFSFIHIPWSKALKYFGISILAMIVLFVAAMIIGLISLLFVNIPYLGIILQALINGVFGGILTALSIALFTGMYYRKIDDIEEDGSLNDDFIMDAIQP